mmetsp:Transcript_26986/g.59011  ORF Transcript_26986/g.59011 Transcript_26986/m.59011 type:complete len:227 (-) Transcript_26986:67-747(-)
MPHSSYSSFLVILQTGNVQQLHIEHHWRGGRHAGPSRCGLEALGEGEGSGDVEATQPPRLHTQQALVQAGNDLAGTHPDVVGGALVEAAVKNAQGGGHGHVVAHHLVADRGAGAPAHHDVPVLQPGGQRDQLLGLNVGSALGAAQHFAVQGGLSGLHGAEQAAHGQATSNGHGVVEQLPAADLILLLLSPADQGVSADRVDGGGLGRGEGLGACQTTLLDGDLHDD